jgi:hypothetical protein
MARQTACSPAETPAESERRTRSYLVKGGPAPAPLQAPERDLDGKGPAVEPILPAHQHTWAELLTLVGAIRHIAHDITMEPDDQMRRIRDAFRDYDQPDED